MEMRQRLAHIMELRYDPSMEPGHWRQKLHAVSGDGVVLRQCPAGSHIINVGTPVEKLLVLAQGECSIFNYSPEGKSVLVNRSGPLQFFGMLELLGGTPHYTATVQATEDCTLLELSGAVYLECVKADSTIMWHSLTYLAAFINQSLSQSEVRVLYPARQRILRYLYQFCRDKSLPTRIMVPKSQLAEELNLNLRTLYRSLDLLYQENLVGRERGKIAVNRQHMARIREEILDFDPLFPL